MTTEGKSSWALGLIRKHCDACATQGWRKEISRRRRRSLRPLPHDREAMRHLCVAIAYSQSARAAQIVGLVEIPVFQSAFADFNPVALAQRTPTAILREYWSRLGHLRFKGKILRILECPRVMNGIIRDCGSFAAYLKSFGIPERIRSQADLDRFWQRFDELQRDFQRRRMPFFSRTTSLLQLLLDLDFDSVKPDLIVMRLVRRIGIVNRETRDPASRECVRVLQSYSIGQSCRAPELDLALLAFGGQSGASQLLTRKFCPASDPCHHAACPVGANRLCSARRLRTR